MCTKWKLTYSTKRDGISLRTLLQRSEDVLASPSLLIVKPLKGKSIFGCYASEGWKISRSHYGNGESFLFRCPTGDASSLSIFPSSGKNDYYQFCDKTFIAMGCGGGGASFGLWINDDISKGSSEEVDTFFNSPLNGAGSDVNFDILSLELWSLGVDNL